jgi:hypothetical protein
MKEDLTKLLMQSYDEGVKDALDSVKEALKIVLEALEDLPGFRADIDNAITAIKAALAQQEKNND